MTKDRLRNLVSLQSEASPRLPFVHSTDAYLFDQILDADILMPEDCQVFGEPLVYLFYGRPSYRVHGNESPNALGHSYPVCILFRNSAPLSVKRIFPFDTGAHRQNLFNQALHKDMELADFQLEPVLSTPGKIISLFFGEVESYLKAKAVSDPKVDFRQFEARSYHAMVSNKLSNTYDDRVSAIELQIDGEIRLTKDAEAIVIPTALYEAEGVESALKAKGIKPLLYSVVDRMGPRELCGQMFALCESYYRKSGLLKGITHEGGDLT